MYHPDWLKKYLLRFQESRSFLGAWQPLSIKGIFASLCLGLHQLETNYRDRAWNYFIVSNFKELAQTVFDLEFQLHVTI